MKFQDYVKPRPAEDNPMGEAAVSLGLPVFPCGPDKKPLTTHGFKDATTDPGRIRTMFRSTSAAMIGVPTGEITGVVVIDVDVKDGAQGRAWLDANSHRMPQTRTNRTGSGGLHIYLRHPGAGQKIRNSASKIAPGIDVRGDGGYVIVPPSPGYVVADNAPIAEIPDWLLPALLPQEPVPAPVAAYQPVRRSYEGGGSHYGLAALEDECNAIRTAGQGTKHNTLNKAAYAIGGLVAAGELQEGFAFGELSHALEDIRPACRDFRAAEKTLRNSFREGINRPRAVPERPVAVEEDIHPAAALLAKLHARASQRSSEPVPVAPGIMDVDGVLRMLVEACNRTAMRPQPFLALGAAICAVGALAGRRYRNRTDLRTNIYIAAICESGGGKDHAPEIIRRALTDAGLDRYLGGENLASGRAVLASLHQHPSRLFQIDELGLFLKGVTGKNAPSHKAEIWSELMKLYSRARGIYRGTEYANQKENARIDLNQPCTCFYGTTTPMTFWSALEGGAMVDGSLARFLVFVTDDHRPPRNKGQEIFETPPDLVDALQAIARGAEGHDYGGNLAEAMQPTAPITPYTVPMTAEADAFHEQKLEDEDRWAAKVVGTPAAAIVNRLAENAAKLALVRAVSRNPARPVIEIPDVQWAWLVAEHCTRALLAEAGKYMADSEYERKLSRAKEIIRKYGPMTDSELFRRGLKLPSKERAELLQNLTSSGEVLAIPTEHQGPGRPAVRYVLATHNAGIPDDDC